MGNRLSKIYTRTGDDGTTGLGDGSRVPKDSTRVEAYGELDELNSVIGLLLAEPSVPADCRELLTTVQHDLFDLGGELCIPGHNLLRPESVSDLEKALDTLNAPLAALQEFILPGGCRTAALAHLARTVCRRAERRCITLANQEPVAPGAVRYLNRLSDLLFVLARHLNRVAGVEDLLWRHDRNPG